MTTLAPPVRVGRFFGDTPELAALRGYVEAHAELRVGRQLSPAEQRVDWLTIDRALEDGKRELHAAIEEEKRRAIKAVTTTGRMARLAVTDKMRAILTALHDIGVYEATAELRALGVEPRAVFAAVEESWLTQLTYRLQQSLNGIGYRIEREVTPLTAMDMSRVEIAAAAERRVPGALDAASRLVSSGFTAGLGEVFGASYDLVDRWEYSAVGDARTCSECRSHDGDEYATWDLAQNDLPGGGPNPSCFGDGRCRCRLVPSLASEPRGPVRGPVGSETVDVSLIPEYARGSVGTLTVAEATQVRDRLASYYKTLKGHMDAGRRTRIPGKLEAMEERLAQLDQHIASGGRPVYDVALLPEYARADVATLDLAEATGQHARLAKYYRTLKGHAEGGRRQVAAGKLEAMELRLKDLTRRIDELGGKTPAPVVRPTPVEPVVVLPPTAGRTDFAKEIDAISRDTTLARTPAPHSVVSTEGVPLAQREAHEQVVAAGRRIDKEIQDRIGGKLDEARDALREADERTAALQAETIRINQDFQHRIRVLDVRQNAILVDLRNRLSKEQFGVPWSQITSITDASAIGRLARAQPEFTVVDTEVNLLRDEWHRRVAPSRDNLDKAYADRKRLSAQVTETEREAILEVLGEIRPMGGAQWDFKTPGRRGKAKQLVDAAAPYYPRDWIDKTRNLGVRHTPRRAKFSPIDNTVIVDNELGSSIHELAHAQEHRDARIVALEQSFYEWRIRGRSWDGPRERPSRMGPGYRRDELARRDEFSEKYMGKDYGGRFYELLSMGLEAVWRADEFTIDDEYRSFILGVLALA